MRFNVNLTPLILFTGKEAPVNHALFFFFFLFFNEGSHYVGQAVLELM